MCLIMPLLLTNVLICWSHDYSFEYPFTGNIRAYSFKYALLFQF